MALMITKCLAPSLRPWIAAIRAHGTYPAVQFQYIRREYNSAAGVLGNWAMDQVPSQSLDVYHGSIWPSPNSARAQSPCVLAPAQANTDSYPDDHAAWWRATWSLGIADFHSVSVLITSWLDPVITTGPTHEPAQLPPARASITTCASALESTIDFTPVRSCSVDGILRCVPLDVYVALQRAARHCGVPFPTRSAFLAPGAGPLVIPHADVRILDALVANPSYGIAGTLALFRGQTTEDQRPNKALQPRLYREHLSAYPRLELLCAIAETGVVPAWRSPEGCVGARPVPAIYPGTDTGSPVVINMLLVDYYRGRAFALVPKKDIPLHIDGHIIQDLKKALGSSVNAQTDTSQSSDATRDPYVSVAQHVRDLRRRYPGYPIYAMGADIADAFHHVPMNARHVAAFGGQIPRSSIGIISGMAVFGWTASPGNFAVFFEDPRVPATFLDDIVLIEVDIEDRVQQAEKRLRDGIKLVFGSEGWHDGKFTTWSMDFHAVGIDWSIPHETISVPQRKIEKRLTAVQLNCVRRQAPGVSMSEFLRKDLEWWKDLIFENESGACQ